LGEKAFMQGGLMQILMQGHQAERAVPVEERPFERYKLSLCSESYRLVSLLSLSFPVVAVCIIHDPTGTN